MPKIPVYERQQTVNPEPQISQLVGGQGAIEQMRALEQTSQKIIGLGETISRVEDARHKAEARDYAFDGFNKDAIDVTRAEQESKSKGLDGHKERMAKWWDQRQTERVKNAPTAMAADAYKEDTQKLQLNSIVGASNYEYIEKAKYNRFKYETAAESYANEAASKPDFNSYEIKANQFEESMRKDTGAFTPTEVEDKVRDIRNGMLVGNYQGLEVQERYQEMKTLLNSNSRFSSDLKPEVKAVLLKRAENGLEQVSRREASKLESSANDLIFKNTNGFMDVRKTQSVISGIQNNKYIEPEDKKARIEALKLSVAVGTDINEAKKLPEGEWNKLQSAQLKADTPGKARVQNELFQALNEIKKQREKDPAQAVSDANPFIKELKKQALASPQSQQFYAEVSLAEQARLGIPPSEQRVTTKQETEFLAMGLNKTLELDNPNIMGAEVDKILNQYGTQSHKVFEELVKDKHIDKGFFVAGQVETPAARSAVVFNLKNVKPIEDAFETKYGKASNTIIEDAVRNSTKQFVGTLNSANSDLKLGEAFQNQVVLEAKKIAAKRSDLDIDDAVDLAKKKIIDDNYTYISGGRSGMYLANSIKGVNQPALERFLIESTSSVSEIKRFSPVFPERAKLVFGDRGEDIYLNELAKTTRWIMSPDKQSLVLVQDDPNGSINPVATIKNGVQIPIQLTINEVMDLQPKISESVQQNRVINKPGGK